MSVAGLEPRISWLLDWVLAGRAIHARSEPEVAFGNRPQRGVEKIMSVGKEPYPKVQYPRAGSPTLLADPCYFSGHGWKPGMCPNWGIANTPGFLINLPERGKTAERYPGEFFIIIISLFFGCSVP